MVDETFHQKLLIVVFPLTIRTEKKSRIRTKISKSLLFHYQLLSHKTYFDTKFNQNKPDQTLEPIEK